MKQYRWQDLSVGLKHEFNAVITEAMMDHFMEDTGDRNPLHVESSYAQRSGFRGRVAYGLLTSSFYSTLVGMHLPGKYCLLHGIDISFLRPVFINDKLTISGEITYLNDAYQQAQINARIINESGEKVSSAKIKVGMVSHESAL